MSILLPTATGALTSVLLKSPVGPLGGAIVVAVDELAKDIFRADRAKDPLSSVALSAIQFFASYYGSMKLLGWQGLPLLSFRSWVILSVTSSFIYLAIVIAARLTIFSKAIDLSEREMGPLAAH